MRRGPALPALLAAILAPTAASAQAPAPAAAPAVEPAAEEAATTIRVTIATDGKVRDCTVLASSGSAELDNSACATMTSRARFRPAVDAQGRPIESTHTSRIRWRIQR